MVFAILVVPVFVFTARRDYSALSLLAIVSAAFRVDAEASMRSLSVLSSKITPAPYRYAFCAELLFLFTGCNS